MIRPLLTTTAALAVLTWTLPAQQEPAAPAVYTSTSTYHVDDEHRAAYETWLKTRYRKYAEALLQQDPTVVSVLATRVIFGGVVEPEVNGYLSVARQGLPHPTPELNDKIAQQAFGKTYAEFLAEARPLRKRMGQVLLRRMAGTPPATEEGGLVRYDYKKITPGRMSDYIQLERDYERLRAAQVKAGSMTGWGMFTLLLPGGSERPFDAITAHSGKTLEQVMNWGRDATSIAASLTPPFNLTGTALRANDLQKIVRSEVRLVVLSVRR